jgi:hypothetical protein
MPQLKIGSDLFLMCSGRVVKATFIEEPSSSVPQTPVKKKSPYIRAYTVLISIRIFGYMYSNSLVQIIGMVF